MVTASFTVTVYQFSPGAYDSITGIPAQQFTPSSARVAVIPKGSSITINGVGYYPKTDAAGITPYDLNEGDYIHVEYQTGASGYWKIMARREIPWGNVLVGYFLDLARVINLPFIPITSGYYGFETIATDTDGIVTEGFEDGFERIIIA